MKGALAVTALSVLVVVPRAQAPDTGTIVGRVTLTTRVKGAALPSNIYQPRTIANRQPADAPEIKNVVVSLKDVIFRGNLQTTHAEIVQTHESFTPRVLAVTRGSTVNFPNGDPIFHNVFSLSSAASFDLGRYPMGRSKSATFTKPGLVKVYCHIHSEMSASILVLDHPFFTAPAQDGTFTLAHVPVGRYTIAGWHERVGERTASVEVIAGQATSVSLMLPVEDVK